jgi:hypothetical protein
VGLVFVDTIYGQEKEFKDIGTYPFLVPSGQVVVDGDDMYSLSGKTIQIGRQVATRVLPSPVAISAIFPSCSTIPPISCTS